MLMKDDKTTIKDKTKRSKKVITRSFTSSISLYHTEKNVTFKFGPNDKSDLYIHSYGSSNYYFHFEKISVKKINILFHINIIIPFCK